MHPDLELGLSHEEEMVDRNEPDDEELTLTDYARCHGLTNRSPSGISARLCMFAFAVE